MRGAPSSTPELRSRECLPSAPMILYTLQRLVGWVGAHAVPRVHVCARSQQQRFHVRKVPFFAGDMEQRPLRLRRRDR